MASLSPRPILCQKKAGETQGLRPKRATQPERTNVALTFIGKVGTSPSDAFRSAVNDVRDAQSVDLA